MNKLIILVEKDSKGLKKHLHEIVFGYYSEKHEVSNREVEIKRDKGGKPFIMVQGEKNQIFSIYLIHRGLELLYFPIMR